MQGTGLSLAQFGLMTHIAAAGDDTISALAERAGLDQSPLSRNLRSLERAGLVEIAMVEQDLRRRAVWLTEAGAQCLQAAIPAWRRAHAALCGGDRTARYPEDGGDDRRARRCRRRHEFRRPSALNAYGVCEVCRLGRARIGGFARMQVEAHSRSPEGSSAPGGPCCPTGRPGRARVRELPMLSALRIF